MRLGIVTPYDLAAPGGVNAYAFTTAAWLRRQGHDVDVIGPASRAGSGPTGSVTIGRARRIRIGGTVAPIAIGPSVGGAMRAHLRHANYDVLHVHEPFMPLASLQAVRQADAPIVATFHGAERVGRWVYRTLRPMLGRWAARLDARTAVSDAAVATARPFADDAEIVPCPIDVNHFASPGKPPAEFNAAARTILFVGRAEPRKGLRTLLEAYGELRAAHPVIELVVVGPRDRAMRGLERSIEQRGWDDVHFLGARPHDALPAYYQAADVFCSPATGGEAFGIVLAEAMAAGAPIVAGDNAGYRNLVRSSDEGILVPPNDATALASALDQVLRDRDLARTLRANGRDRVAELDVARVGQRLLALYHRAGPGRL
jgi:phosphatidylinositol alpha-mannosyltransferase